MLYSSPVILSERLNFFTVLRNFFDSSLFNFDAFVGLVSFLGKGKVSADARSL